VSGELSGLFFERDRKESESNEGGQKEGVEESGSEAES
jgi:hypothetical protein